MIRENINSRKKTKWMLTCRESHCYCCCYGANLHDSWLTPSSSDRLSEVEIWDAIHESIFDVVQPEGEEYDREVAIHVTSAGHVAGPGEGPVGGADAFMNAKISFKDPEAKTFKASFVVRCNYKY